MISVRIAGGLGNQLFQAGVALAAQRRTGAPVRIRAGALAQYAVPRALLIDKVLDFSAVPVTIDMSLGAVLRYRLPKWWRLCPPGVLLLGDRNAKSVFQSNIPSRIIIDGYFVESLDQNQFDEILDIIRPLAVVRASAAHKPDRSVCMIHMRGGDFVRLGITGGPEVEYYANAVATVRSRRPDIKFRVLTDDVEYSRRVAVQIGLECEIASGSVLEDFELLRGASFKILSASTFAFWAAALSFEPDVTVIAPPEWRPGCRRQLALRSERLPCLGSRSGLLPTKQSELA